LTLKNVQQLKKKMDDGSETFDIESERKMRGFKRLREVRWEVKAKFQWHFKNKKNEGKGGGKMRAAGEKGPRSGFKAEDTECKGAKNGCGEQSQQQWGRTYGQ